MEEETIMNKWMVNALAVVVAMAVASSVSAAPLVPPGADVSGPSIVFSGTGPWGNPASLTLVASQTSSFSAAPLAGSLTTLVYREASGTLDFFYQVTSTTSDHATHVSVNGYGTAAITTNGGYVTDPTILPALAALTPGTVGFNDVYRLDADVVGGNFTGGLSNATSDWLVIQTNSTTYGSATAFIQDGAQATAATFAPSPTPLPSSLVLFATGAFGMVGGLFRRFRRNPM
jgi:hypothetical protein